MSLLFLKTLKANRLAPEELDGLVTSLQTVKLALENGSVPNPAEINSTASALYLFALQSEDRKKELLTFIPWFSQPEEDITWSEELLSLVSRFFNEVQWQRVGSILEKISLQKSLTSAKNAPELVSRLNDPNLRGLYNNKVDELNIDFTVSVLPFDLEVLDPRIVTVKPGKANEMHRHAHETIFIFLQGEGKVIVDNFENSVKPGDFAFIPRWCNHQSVNTGTEDLVFLAVADFGLTGKSFVGNYMKTARMKTV
jgi:quercetin dioxygenase-like cupin family protein